VKSGVRTALASTLAALAGLSACPSNPAPEAPATVDADMTDVASAADAEATDAGPTFEEYAWAPPEDAATVRLCAESANPDTVTDPFDIDCAVEGQAYAPADVAPKDDLVVMVYNIERGFQLDGQLDVLLNDPAVPRPDVILLAEADRGCPRTQQRNITAEMAEALQMNYVFAVEFIELQRNVGPPAFTESSCEHGNAILSRYPIGNVRVLRHEAQLSWWIPLDAPDPVGGEPRMGGRIAIAADIRVGDRILHVYSVHLESRPQDLVNAKQMAELAEDGLDRSGPVVIGGDYNCPVFWWDLQSGQSEDPIIAELTSRGYVDSHDGLPYEDRITAPPGLVLDLLYGRNVTFSAPGICDETVCGGLSDHLPAWATVSLD